jgi:hypothetical protein
MVEKNKSERFFTFSWSKAGWTLLLGIVAYYLLWAFMDLYRASTASYQIQNLFVWFNVGFSWVFFFVQNLLLMVLSYFIKIDNPTPFVENLVIYGPVVVNLIWDYFLVCLVYSIIRKFKK